MFGPSDVVLGGGSSPLGTGRIDAVSVDQQLGNSFCRRDTQAHGPTARPDGGQDVFGAGRAEDPHRGRRWFFDGFEQHVGGAFGHAVGVFDDHDAPIGVDR